jgi:hypothetical protein
MLIWISKEAFMQLMYTKACFLMYEFALTCSWCGPSLFYVICDALINIFLLNPPCLHTSENNHTCSGGARIQLGVQSSIFFKHDNTRHESSQWQYMKLKVVLTSGNILVMLKKQVENYDFIISHSAWTWITSVTVCYGNANRRLN